jgi:hypothetical protein
MNTSKSIGLVGLAVTLLSLRFTVQCGGSSNGEGAIRGLPDVGFGCGPALVCNPTGQYCSVLRGGPAGTQPGYACVDVPGALQPTCESIPDIGIGCACVAVDGGVTVTCTAP